ncbi:putative bifunctional diguanylate cyclase/phosphodiesterase, partial [Roseovarius sp. SYSU LYC5161]|uniref:putative bifunctional diguanylate cyclase/phosphodiesterase n=1 Tax=Roseovarius halophilus (ex Wu et al. 2025) TaxID=3376060 RepID=UPI00399AB3DE
MLESTRDGIVLQDVSGRIEWLNPAAERMFGWPLSDVIGRKPQEFVLPPDARPPAADIAGFRYDLDSPIFGRNLITRHMRRDGTFFWNQQSFAVIDPGPGADGKRVMITCRDVTEQVTTETDLRRAQVDLEHAAHHDDLTGLANRKRLAGYLASDGVARQVGRGALSVLQIDIDKFKDINDTLGHGAGDAALCHLARALRGCCGAEDLICRTGGDEFILVCFQCPQSISLETRAEQVLAAAARPLTWHDRTIRLGCSIGAARAGPGDDTGEDLIRRADQALYAAKRRGRGQVVIHTEALGRYHMARQQLSQDLRAAIDGKQFIIHLQPQMTLADNRITGCEALIRWQHPRHGLLAPGQFLPAAETAGLLAEIDHISTTLALDALVALNRAGATGLTMSINVSAATLADANYPALLDWALQARGLAACDICVEILETTILDGADIDIVTAVEQLKRLGVRLALDDFGTGYAGLAHMARFEIDAIKLDRSMISQLERDPRNRVIIRAIIRLCSLLGMRTVAEGVETREQLDILRRANCPVIQGYGLARPMPLAELTAWLDRYGRAAPGVPDTTPARRAA